MIGSQASTRHQDNCFDFIRHLAAFLVLYSHHFALAGRTQPTVPGWDTYGFIGVITFFAISGYLMPQSHANAGGFLPFMARRCRRIFPGLIVCSFIMVYGIGFAFSVSEGWSYLLNPKQLKNFLDYATFGGRPIQGVFSDFIVKDALNGSLWTLRQEFYWYIIIGIALSISSSWRTAAILLLVSSTAILTLNYLQYDRNIFHAKASYLALFGVAFTAGALLSITKSWRPYRFYLAATAILVLICLRGFPGFQALGTASVALLIIAIGVSFKDRLIRGRFDISYGVYIYAFPIQQIVINRITGEFWTSMLIASILTAIAGTLSYFFVEKRFLRGRVQQVLELKRVKVCDNGLTDLERSVRASSKTMKKSSTG